MGIVRTEERKGTEIEEFRRMVQSACAALHRRKDEEELRGLPTVLGEVETDGGEKVVCVTSGVSYIGRAVVNRLLLGGYSVRIMVDNQEDLEKLREMETSGEMGAREGYNIRAVVAKMSDVDSLLEAIHGCHGVFHTAALADPAGLSGYSKHMAEVDAKATENMMEACARTPSIRKCVMTSSLLACVWRDSAETHSSVINHDSWSDESFCLEKKLWYALGKLRAEKVAWRIADERGLKLTAICSGLITGPQFCIRNPTATIAYLKGSEGMYLDGLLATVEVTNLAEAHVRVYEDMNKSASGRYICYDQVIDGYDKAMKLAQEIGMTTEKICGSSDDADFRPRFQLSNRKLAALQSRAIRCCYEQRHSVVDPHYCK